MLPNISIFFLILFSLISTSSSAQSELSLVTAQWDTYTHLDGSGLYFEIMDSALGKKSYKSKLVPWKRAQETFEKGQADLLLGEADNLPYCSYPKWPIDGDFFSAYYLKSKIAILPTTAKMSEKRVIWVRGYDIDKFAPGLKASEEVDSLAQGAKLVQGGRADILIDYDQDLKDLLKNQGLDAKEHMVTPTSISGGYIWLCFRKTPEGKLLSAEFDTKMQKLFDSGQLKKIFKKYDRMKNYEKVVDKMKSKK